MIEFILSLPTWVGCGFAMVLTTVLGLVVYVVSYKLIEKSKNVKLKDPINSLFRMVGILVSLMHHWLSAKLSLGGTRLKMQLIERLWLFQTHTSIWNILTLRAPERFEQF